MTTARFPRLVGGLLLAALVAGGGYAWWAAQAPPPPPADLPPPEVPHPPDPRVSFPTPFRNVQPGVEYVGDLACSGCHPAVAHTYHQHPMGRSAEPVRPVGQLERYDPAAGNPRISGPFALRAEPTADAVLHHLALAAKLPGGAAPPPYTTRADLALGSGTRGRSYVSFEGGAAWQSPLSWYAADGGRWDKSPGFDLGTGGRRAVISECLFCHVDRVDPVPGSRNRFREPFPVGQAAVGCERCHGPGELHVVEQVTGMAAAGVDTSIVNPKHLPPELRAAVCEQCHLQGQERVTRRGRDVWEFRPGLPFDQFVSVFVRHPNLAESHRSVGQFEQMEQSRCFTASGGRLGCTSCHDPHGVPAAAEKAGFYRAKCLTCHDRKGCSAPPADRQARADSCVACHMPRADSANIVHASVTDHRVPRRPAPPPARRGLGPGDLPLLPFRVGPHAPPEAERERDYGIALSRVVGPLAGSPAEGLVVDAAAGRLTPFLRTAPTDADGWLAVATLRGAVGDREGRFEATAAAARAAPNSEVALSDLGDAALATGRLDAAAAAADELVRRSPSDVDARSAQAAVLYRRGEWAKAEAACRAALTLNPLAPNPRMYLAVCRHRQGDPAGGRREAEAAAALKARPDQKKLLIEWYARETGDGR